MFFERTAPLSVKNDIHLLYPVLPVQIALKIREIALDVVEKNCDHSAVVVFRY